MGLQAYRAWVSVDHEHLPRPLTFWVETSGYEDKDTIDRCYEAVKRELKITMESGKARYLELSDIKPEDIQIRLYKFVSTTDGNDLFNDD